MTREMEERTARAVTALWEAIDARADELVSLVAALVRRPSLLGQEAEAQAYVAETLAAAGMETDVWDLDEDIKTLPNAGDSGVPFAGRPNVAGVRRGAGGGRSLILNGHIDVVSPEPLSAWTHSPWAAEIVGTRMYGRGAFDMKSGVAINCFLPRVLRDLGIALAGDLIVHSVIEEECTGNGALAASLRHRADAAVVTEPELNAFTWAHLGSIWFRVQVTGKSWHAMETHKGVNAISKTVPIIRALEQLHDDLNVVVHPAFADVYHPVNLNIGVIRGGDWPSTVPGACELHCRVSTFPGQTVAEVRARIEETVRRATEGDAWFAAHPARVTYDGFGSEGSVVDRDEPFVQLLGEYHARVFGQPLTHRVGTAICDMRYYNFIGVPSGCYGAVGEGGHAADEWLDLTSLAPTAKVLGGFLLDWCGVM